MYKKTTQKVRLEEQVYITGITEKFNKNEKSKEYEKIKEKIEKQITNKKDFLDIAEIIIDEIILYNNQKIRYIGGNINTYEKYIEYDNCEKEIKKYEKEKEYIKKLKNEMIKRKS